ncbi:primosomal replication protein N [Propionivibrio limicola]|uniref:primosomal replication protein N n=1 Tax=Propionivibrio limicola TaxID=167645 RepID=UPI002483CB65|nr:primosomal replication protein N [Propionivibrio limicola]
MELSGTLIERKALRFTPAGVPVTECVLEHQSEQVEAGSPRRVACHVQAIALGDAANWLQGAAPGVVLNVTGFLASRSQNSKQLRVHITTIEFAEGNQNG